MITPVFPTIPAPLEAQARELCRRLDAFARMPLAEQQALQNRQCAALLRHARQHSPFWAERLRGMGEAFRFDALPVLTRDELQTHFDAMRAAPAGEKDWATSVHSTSGSTGQPVRVERLDAIYGPLFLGTGLLDCVWHAPDFTQKWGAVRQGYGETDSIELAPPYRWYKAHRPGFTFVPVNRSMTEVYDACVARQPSILFGGAATADALAQVALERGERSAFPLRQYWSLGETVTEEMRTRLREAFGAVYIDRYSSEETGWIALQCPRHDHYHVAGGTTLVEVVRDDGTPCAVGEPGRVLLTSLHSYAMPIVRYEIGDIAEGGPPCDCGIRLPVLKRIWGRQRRLITTPDGKRVFVRIYARFLEAVQGVREFRFVLHSDNVVAVHLAKDGPVTPADRTHLEDVVHRNFGYPYQVVVVECERVDWGHSYKREDFTVSERPYFAPATPDAARGSSGRSA